MEYILSRHYNGTQCVPHTTTEPYFFKYTLYYANPYSQLYDNILKHFSKMNSPLDIVSRVIKYLPKF